VLLAEHAQNLDAPEMVSYVQECKNLSNDKVILIPGLEFGFSEYPNLHLLAIGINIFIEPTDIVTTIKKIHEQDGIAIIAHPSRNNHFVPDEITPLLDGIEVWNAAYDSRYFPNPASLKLYNNLKEKNRSLLAFIGMDMHSVNGFREMTIQIHEQVSDKNSIIAKLKRGFFVNRAKLFKLHPNKKTGLIFHILVHSARILLDLADAVYWKLPRQKKQTTS
jgi:hypothetical protein